MKLNEKIEAIADKYGLNIQSVKLAEECAEYAAATLKIVYYQLLNDNSLILGLDKKIVAEKLDEARGNGTEELADVLLLSRQLEYIINKYPEARETMDKLMSEKADRQLERIKESSKNEWTYKPQSHHWADWNSWLGQGYHLDSIFSGQIFRKKN